MARARVTMSDEVLAAIDEVVGKRGRSRFLEQAASEKLGRLALEKAIVATAGVATASAYSHRRDRAATAAWVRETRRTESRA